MSSFQAGFTTGLWAPSAAFSAGGVGGAEVAGDVEEGVVGVVGEACFVPGLVGLLSEKLGSDVEKRDIRWEPAIDSGGR